MEVRFGGLTGAGEKFANGFANEPRSTAWRAALQAGIIAWEMPNWSTRLTTKAHVTARESSNSKTVLRVTLPWVRIPPSPLRPVAA